jgi:hypothetical protein
MYRSGRRLRVGEQPLWVRQFGGSRWFDLAMDREALCLRLLEGLAVPARVELAPEQLGELKLLPGATSVVQAFAPGESLSDAGLSPLEVIGAWLFVVEQLAAFRLHQILYTDLVPRHFRFSRASTRLTIVDFTSATGVDEVLPDDARTRPENDSPEARRGSGLTERSYVYQLAWILRRLLGRSDGTAELTSAGAPGLEPLIERCLSEDPGRRPADYVDLWDEILAADLPPPVLAFWGRLRAPYTERLAEVELV